MAVLTLIQDGREGESHWAHKPMVMRGVILVTPKSVTTIFLLKKRLQVAFTHAQESTSDIK